MNSRTVIVTGGNTGLGYGCAAALLSTQDGQPWHVVLACRDAGRAAEAVKRLSDGARRGATVEAMSLDLASFQSIKDFAAEIASRLDSGTLPPLRGLVCNAGLNPGATRTTTVEGFETTFGVNHLGHFLLVDLLRPTLVPPARIAVVASGVHDPAQKTGVPAPAWNAPGELAHGRLGPASADDGAMKGGMRLYSTSKLANVYFSYALARRLPDGITVNAFDPGLMPGTGLSRSAPAYLRFVFDRVLPRIIPLLRRVMSNNVHTTEESGQALARLVTDPALATTTGRYFEGLQEIPSSKESYDEQRAEELWRVSESLTAARTG